MILTKLEAEEDRIKLLSMLSSIRWEKQHSKILQARQQDTATWIFDLMHSNGGKQNRNHAIFTAMAYVSR